MSLINKMLQDLDSRGSGPAGSLAASVKLAPPSDRRMSWPLVVGVVAIAAIAAAGGAVFWRSYKTVQAIPSPADRMKLAAAPKAAAAPVAPPAAVVPAPTVDATGSPIVTQQSAAARALAASQVAATALPASSATASTGPAGASLIAGSGSTAGAPAASAPAANGASETSEAPAASASVSAAAKAKPAASSVSTGAAVPKAKPATASAKARAKAAARAKAKAAKAAKAVSAPSAGLELTNAQRAESEYRRGLASLQDGRNGEAINALEQAVRLDPRHDAARQTVVGLLIEARRSEEAVRHLHLGLTLEPRQPAMAMLLARLQIERGGSGIETLKRTLPYATGNADYHALLAGALARESRHQEAAEQYRLALRGAANNGAWLIGLGISLQSEKRDAEALDAFKRAKASGSLTPELLTYAERRINALSR